MSLQGATEQAAPWPDWPGETVAIVASGPSLKQENLDLLRGSRVKVVAIKESIERCPFAAAVYGCDAAWWLHRRGLPDFNGLKFAWGDKACDNFPDIMRVTIKDPMQDRMLFDQIGSVGAGGNSGFQAINLAVQFGASRILLLGFDMHDRGGVHWYGRNTWTKANNPDESNFMRWRAAFAVSAKQLTERGVEVINASAHSDLKCFPRRPMGQALSGWVVGHFNCGGAQDERLFR